MSMFDGRCGGRERLYCVRHFRAHARIIQNSNNKSQMSSHQKVHKKRQQKVLLALLMRCQERSETESSESLWWCNRGKGDWEIFK